MSGGAYMLAEIEISPKFVFAMIFLFIWLISAFVSWVSKQQQQLRQRQLRLEAEQAARIGQRVSPPPPPRQRPMPQAPVPPRRPPQRIAEGIAQRFPDVLLPPAPPPPIPQQQQRQRPAPPPPPRPPQQRRQAKQPAPRRAVPSLPAQPMVELTPADAPYVNITQPVARTKAPTVDATAIHAWMTPATLRQQFILTELLQPPLSMREGAEHLR